MVNKLHIFYSVRNGILLLLIGLLVAALVGFIRPVVINHQPPRKPNVLFILVDDLGWRDVGAFGSTFYETPNIDALAAQGTKFTNAYAACPVCSPTRASILTGKYPARLHTTDWFGAPQPETVGKHWTRNKPLLPAPYEENLPLDEITLAEALKQHGYQTFFAGKWHLGESAAYWPEQQGFDLNKGGYWAGSPSPANQTISKRIFFTVRRMKTLPFFPGCLLLWLGTTTDYAQLKVGPARPNVLFIAVDDLKPLLGCYGESRMKTPHLDRLARIGTVFLNNYCQQAVCAPTRASLLTGQRPDYTQVWDLQTLMRNKNPNILTLPQYFRQNGYATTGIGKVFDNRSVDKQDDAPSWSLPYEHLRDSDFAEGYGPPKRNYYQAPETLKLLADIEKKADERGLTGEDRAKFLNANRGPAYESAEVPDDAYTDGAVAKRAVATLATLAKGGQPFFYAVGFVRPHLPFVSPKKYWNLYDPADIKTADYQQFAQNSPDIAYQASGELTNAYVLPNGERYPGGYAPKPDEQQRAMIHGYYASVSYMDAQVGKLLDELDRLNLTKNTIIVLWGDHGWHLGDHGMWCKHTNFEQATRAPLLIAAPGYKGGQKATGLTEFVDVFPTLTALAELKTPEKLAGKSLVPLLKNPRATVKQYAQSQYPRRDKAAAPNSDGRLMGYAIRTDRYRYVAWFAEDFAKNKVLATAKPVAVELYDYQKDPHETVSVADDESYQAVASEHRNLLTDFLATQNQSR